MERLILMRHGKAERHAQTGGDFERALVESGRADASMMGKLLAGLAYAPDLLLVSSARRTHDAQHQHHVEEAEEVGSEKIQNLHLGVRKNFRP